MALHKTPVIVKLPAWRRRVLLIAVLLGLAALLVRGIYLQSFHKQFLQAKGDARYSRTITLQSHRGKITDRFGDLLAISSPVESVWASPPDVKITQAQTKEIATLLGIKASDIDKKLVNTEREFVYLKRRVSPELAAKVMKVGVSGIYLQREYKRYYPAGEVAAHLVGFTGIDDNGQEGFELAKNDSLSGKAGSRRVIKDRSGHIVEDLEAVNVPKDGSDLVLSIDNRIQYLAHREIAKAVDASNALAGSVVVLDAKTGEVLAMANMPTYNPNNPINIRGKTRNRSITDVFEPGSTMKAISVSAGLESGLYQADTKINTAPGYMSIGPATIHDSHAHGVLSVSQVIQVSSNVGASKIALSLDNLYLWNIFNQIGFGAKTGIHFPGEAAGRVRDYKKWRPIEKATMSYGHGISVTLLQLARSYTVFANEGELKPVSLIKLQEPPVGTQVFSPNTANDMKAMLESVVMPGGTALRAQVVGYRVAGKTGTTHKLGAQGYEDNKYVASFVGMAPASNPRLIVAVMIDEPNIANKQYFGGVVAAPVFSAVMGDALRILAVPQDSPSTNVVIPPEEVIESVDDVKETT
ncbi:MAG TPA: penicillin-binding protein 2 [Methylotenera sp.]|nr:penicillin-binding protein 2 [Methylotenera sp.]HPH05917.1 penicillin-binding protein 2 [Methylotenera sp.]HPN00698.1 penicillin-binding protein 2 [Methylotenera sp.]